MKKNYFISMLLLAVVIAAAINSGCVSEPKKISNLRVTNIDLVAGEVKTSTIELKVTSYVKNIAAERGGKTSENLTLLLKAVSSDRDFLVNQTETFIGKVEPDKEVNVTTTLILPKKGGYTLKAILYEEGKEVASGSRSVSKLESLPADSRVTGLRIDGIDFLVRKAAEGKVLIQSDVYVTNTGGKSSKDYRLMLKATDLDSQLVADKQWNRTGVIHPDETAISSVNLTVPDNYNYVVDALLWDNSTIVGQGQDYVQLNATTMLTGRQRIAGRGTDAGDFALAVGEPAEEAYEPAAAAEMKVSGFENETVETAKEEPGFGVVAALFAAAIGAAAARRRG